MAGNQEDRNRTLRTHTIERSWGEYGGFNAAMKKGAGLESLPGHESRKGSRLITCSMWRATVVTAPEETG